MTEFLKNSKTLFAYYRSLGEQSFSQLSEEDIHFRNKDASNSIAILVKHLSGNMLSRWTDFLTSDGEKDWRNRDSEFEDDIKDKNDLIERWNLGWDCLESALASINEDNQKQLVYIRNEGHSILEAVQRQLTHYAYHVGQIVFLAKEIKGEAWQSLSVPKGESKSYNKEKFSKEKKKKNFI